MFETIGPIPIVPAPPPPQYNDLTFISKAKISLHIFFCYILRVNGNIARVPTTSLRIIILLKNRGIFWIFSFYVRYSTLLHLPPLRFDCVLGCWDRTQDSCDYGIGWLTGFLFYACVYCRTQRLSQKERQADIHPLSNSRNIMLKLKAIL